MLLQPDASLHARMEREVVDEWHPEHIYSAGPEQEYLSRFFADRWHHISATYNFQLFRMSSRGALAKFGPEAELLGSGTELPGPLKAVQFSSITKPWHFRGLATAELQARLRDTLEQTNRKLDQEEEAPPMREAMNGYSLSGRLLQHWLDRCAEVEAKLTPEQRVELDRVPIVT